jgi:drug/metabolite transporter (DMT)-like permease
MTKFGVIIAVAFCAVLGAIAQILFKLGVPKVSWLSLNWVHNKYIISGIVLYIIALIVFLNALKYERLSVVYPLIATSYIWVALLCNQFLGEPISLWQWMGFILIVAGVSLVGFK